MLRRLGPLHSHSSTPDALVYLERFGGYAASRELGMLAWLMGHLWNASMVSENLQVRDLAALVWSCSSRQIWMAAAS